MSGAGTAARWYSIRAVLDGDAAPRWASALAAWVRDTVGAPLPALGRAGSLCPFVPRALQLASLFACDSLTDDPGDIRRVIEAAKRDFPTTFPLRGEADNLKALIVAFPKLQPLLWPALKAARTTVKPDFIASGLTLSEFHDGSDDRSVHNHEVRIGRSPVPCIVIRRLQTHDALFLRSQPTLYPIFLRRMKHSASNG